MFCNYLFGLSAVATFIARRRVGNAIVGDIRNPRKLLAGAGFDHNFHSGMCGRI